jgi:ABC-type phosphate/phosphonate transport system substrate-binding protein
MAIDDRDVAARCSLRRRGGVREDSMLMRKTLRCAALALVVAGVVLAAPARAEDTVTIGTVGSPSANLWPLFIGIEKGFYAAANVKADLVFIQSSAAVIQQLSAGSLDVSMSTGIVDPLRAIDQGAALALTRFEVQVPLSGQKAEDVDKSYDFFNKNNFFDRTGKISRAKMTALIDALVGLGDVKSPGNVERFLLPGVAQLAD